MCTTQQKRTDTESQMRKVSLFGIAIIIMLGGVWASSSHSAVKPAIESGQIDPLSLMAKAKNLPTQESLNLKMWPDDGPLRY
jgi:hypothetical protein